MKFLSNNKKIDKRAARNMVKYIRELEDPAYRLDKFWRNEPDLREYDFQTLKERCGLALEDTQKNKPWYHVLVHGQGNETYVAESNLTSDDNIDPVDHPFVDIFFYEYDNSGQYSLKQTFN